MNSAASRQVIAAGDVDRVREARTIIRQEADALRAAADQLDTSFSRAIDLIVRCRGSIVVTGVGKAGLVGRKITATLSSVGCPSHFLHPVEAVHGDLGTLNPDDVVLAISNSGESAEVVNLLPVLRGMELPIIAITATDDNSLAAASDVVVTTGRFAEAGALKLAPSTSTTAMIAIGDALALVSSRVKSFTAADFAMVHPAGKIGQGLKCVQDVMRPPNELRIARETVTVRELLVQVAQPGRRTGAVLLVDDRGRLTGLFTDSDLARILEQRRDEQLDRPASEIMTRDPITAGPGDRLSIAVETLSERKLSELPVVDASNRPIGLLDITDIIGLGLPASARPSIRIPDPGSSRSVG